MKKRFFSVITAAAIACGVFSTPVQTALGSVSVHASAAQVSAPAASKKSGTYYSSSGFYVTLSCATKNAKIYYSKNGGEYKLYTGKIGITKNTTLKIYSKSAGSTSAVVTYTYKLMPKIKNSVEAAAYSTKQTVKLSSGASGVKFYYTLDGTKPTTKSAKYTSSGIVIDKTCKLRVLAYKSGWTKSYKTYSYTIGSNALQSESILDKYTEKYCYSTLTAAQKKGYARLFDTVAAHNASADVSDLNLTRGDVEKIYWAFDYDNPQFFWLGSGYSYSFSGNSLLSISPAYSRTKTEAEKILPKFNAAAKKITDKALAADSLFERVKIIHDGIVNGTRYKANNKPSMFEADGPLVDGEAVCEGYSKAFMYLCQSVGIPCICVSGVATSGHMWNMVQLEGEWYHMDVTWDDPVGNTDVCKYDYFCLTDKQINSDHRVDNPFPVPKATATKYNYYNISGTVKYTDVNKAYDALVEAAVENYNKGIYTTEIVVDKSIMEQFHKKFKESGFLSTLKSRGCKVSTWSVVYGSTSYKVTVS